MSATNRQTDVRQRRQSFHQSKATPSIQPLDLNSGDSLNLDSSSFDKKGSNRSSEYLLNKGAEYSNKYMAARFSTNMLNKTNSTSNINNFSNNTTNNIHDDFKTNTNARKSTQNNDSMGEKKLKNFRRSFASTRNMATLDGAHLEEVLMKSPDGAIHTALKEVSAALLYNDTDGPIEDDDYTHVRPRARRTSCDIDNRGLLTKKAHGQVLRKNRTANFWKEIPEARPGGEGTSAAGRTDYMNDASSDEQIKNIMDLNSGSNDMGDARTSFHAPVAASARELNNRRFSFATNKGPNTMDGDDLEEVLLNPGLEQNVGIMGNDTNDLDDDSDEGVDTSSIKTDLSVHNTARTHRSHASVAERIPSAIPEGSGEQVSGSHDAMPLYPSVTGLSRPLDRMLSYTKNIDKRFASNNSFSSDVEDDAVSKPMITAEEYEMLFEENVDHYDYSAYTNAHSNTNDINHGTRSNIGTPTQVPRTSSTTTKTNTTTVPTPTPVHSSMSCAVPPIIRPASIGECSKALQVDREIHQLLEEKNADFKLLQKGLNEQITEMEVGSLSEEEALETDLAIENFVKNIASQQSEADTLTAKRRDNQMNANKKIKEQREDNLIPCAYPEDEDLPFLVIPDQSFRKWKKGNNDPNHGGPNYFYQVPSTKLSTGNSKL